MEKIIQLIESSRYSIHDLSRCQARAAQEHYRLNMPFELGLDFGCRRYGGEPLSGKVILILEEKPYRYQAAVSDLAGNDIEAHGGDPETAVRKVRNWIDGLGDFELIGPHRIFSEYEDFYEWYYERQLEAGFSERDIQDYSTPKLLKEMRHWTEKDRPR